MELNPQTDLQFQCYVEDLEECAIEELQGHSSFMNISGVILNQSKVTNKQLMYCSFQAENLELAPPTESQFQYIECIGNLEDSAIQELQSPSTFFNISGVKSINLNNNKHFMYHLFQAEGLEPNAKIETQFQYFVDTLEECAIQEIQEPSIVTNISGVKWIELR